MEQEPVKVEIGPNSVTFEGGAAKLAEWRDLYAWNDRHAEFKRHFGREFDPENPDDVAAAANWTRVPGWRTWLLMGQGHKKDPETGEPLQVDRASDGWKYPGVLTSLGTRWRVTGTGIVTLMDDLLAMENPPAQVTRKLPALEAGAGWDGLDTGGLEPTPAQLEAVVRTLEAVSEGSPAVLLDLAVNTGKTLIMGMLTRALLNANPGLRVLMPFRSKDLCRRAVDDYRGMGFKVAAVAASVKDDGVLDGAEVVVAMVQTLHARKDVLGQAFFRGFGAVVVDECDAFVNDSTDGMFAELTRNRLTVGLSGTPFTHALPSVKAAVALRYGKAVATRTVEENVLSGTSLPAHVNMNPVYHQAMPAHATPGRAVHVALHSEDRRDVLYAILRRHRGKKIIIYTGQAKIEHLNWLARCLRAEGWEPATYHGQVENREQLLAWFEAAEGGVVMLANRVMQRGINLPGLQVWVQWEPSDDRTALEQAAIGRGSRRNGKDDHFVVEDFVDVGSPFLTNRAVARIAAYRQGKGATVRLLYDADKDGRPV